ncbi:hypothetical protein Sjap_009556 [Stephania japonica]|uniref:Uncharacterized protein n=1 Tax=Stephania japonica TaxID=461633 RepID=A0AAP0JU17_9MAGN
MGANTTPFSIRDYVLAVRDKDIYLNWPFRDKHLQLFMKLGVSRVLPPFESHDSMRKNQSNGDDFGSNHAKDDKTICSSIDKPNVGLYREEVPMMEIHDHIEKNSLHSSNHMVHHSTTDKAFNDMDKVVAVVTATKKLRYKRKKRKGKPKMRSMVDICAEARPCTLEELDKIDRSKWIDSRSLGPYTDNQDAMEGDHIANEVSESMVTVDYHDNKSYAAAESFRKTKHPRDGVGICDKSVLDKKNLLMKIKFNRCRS